MMIQLSRRKILFQISIISCYSYYSFNFHNGYALCVFKFTIWFASLALHQVSKYHLNSVNLESCHIYQQLNFYKFDFLIHFLNHFLCPNDQYMIIT